MAYELKSVFEVVDKATNPIKRITRQMEQLNRAMEQSTRTGAQFNNAMNRQSSGMRRVTNTVNNNTTTINHNTNAIRNNITQINHYNNAASSMRSNISGQASTLGNLRNMLLGVATAYIGAQGAAKAFDATIGAAARFEQSEVVIKAMFSDAEASSKYLKMVDSMAIDSPILNSGDMFANSGSLVSLTKDLDTLGASWSLVEKLMAKNPLQGVEGAVYAIRELAGGDAISMADRFDISKKDLNPIKNLSFDKQVVELDKLLAKLNITDSVVTAMGSTSLGYWSQLVERAQVFGRILGRDSNSKLNKTLAGIVNSLDEGKMKKIAAEMGESLGKVMQKAIDIGKFMWKWREPITYVVSAVGAAMAALAGVGIIAALANPVSLIAAGIAAAAVGMKALYDNSATFRGMIDGIVTKAKELWSAFQSGGVGGVFENLFGEGTFDGFMTKFNEVKTWIMAKIAELQPTFDRLKEIFSQVWSTLSSMMSSAWSIISPILNGLWSVIQIIGDVAVIVFNNVIAPALSFLGTLFQTLWAIAQPILLVLSGLFEALGAIIKWLWDNVLSSLVKFIMSALKNAFDNFSDALSIVGGWFEKITGWAQTAKDKLGQFADFISSIKLPKWVTNGVNAVVTTVGNAIGGGGEKAKSHYHGIDYVPKDRYAATLHKGEAVLPRQEAEAYRQGQGGFGGVTITGNNFTVREDADINRIADELVSRILRERGVFA